MGLFDDLLKKPSNTTQSSGGTSGSSGNDPLAEEVSSPLKIEKTEETAFGTEDTYTSPVISEPPKVTAVAEDDVSSILIGSTEQKAPTQTQEVSENISFITNDTGNENPVVADEKNEVQETEVAATLFDVLDNNESEKTQGNTEPKQEEITAVAEEIESPLDTPAEFSLTSENQSSALLENQEEVNEEARVFHPEEFIEESLTKIESMIATIDARHEAKLAEAEGYKSEKERFAQLEQKAHDEADMMITERNHAERMQNYFMSEKQNQTEHMENVGGEQKTSVETTLTGLAVQNAVTTTVETKGETATEAAPIEASSLLTLAA